MGPLSAHFFRPTKDVTDLEQVLGRSAEDKAEAEHDGRDGDELGGGAVGVEDEEPDEEDDEESDREQDRVELADGRGHVLCESCPTKMGRPRPTRPSEKRTLRLVTSAVRSR